MCKTNNSALTLANYQEAYVKALGRGFSAAPFRTFTIQSRDSKGLQTSPETSSDVSLLFELSY